MERDFKAELAAFDEVWRRVQQGRVPAIDGLTLMPRRAQKSAAVRFTRPDGRK